MKFFKPHFDGGALMGGGAPNILSDQSVKIIRLWNLLWTWINTVSFDSPIHAVDDRARYVSVWFLCLHGDPPFWKVQNGPGICGYNRGKSELIHWNIMSFIQNNHWYIICVYYSIIKYWRRFELMYQRIFNSIVYIVGFPRVPIRRKWAIIVWV